MDATEGLGAAVPAGKPAPKSVWAPIPSCGGSCRRRGSQPVAPPSRGAQLGRGLGHLTPSHTWSPDISGEDVLADNVAGGGTVPSSCSPRWDIAPRPEVSVDAAAAQKPKLWKEFECYIYTLTNKSTACHRYTVLLKLLIFIS